MGIKFISCFYTLCSSILIFSIKWFLGGQSNFPIFQFSLNSKITWKQTTLVKKATFMTPFKFLSYWVLKKRFFILDHPIKNWRRRVLVWTKFFFLDFHFIHIFTPSVNFFSFFPSVFMGKQI